MKAVLILIFLLLFNCFGKTALCQYRDLSFNHLSVNNGLSQGVNNCIFKDSKGYTWISSFDGLNRFDGIDCVIYRDISGDSASIKGTLFLNILEDKNNNLWIGSNEGLNFYNRKLNSFTCFYIPNSRSVNQTFSPFYIDNENNIWLQAGKDILYLNTVTGKFKIIYHFDVTGNLAVIPTPVKQLQPLQKIIVALRGGTEIYAAGANTQKLDFSMLMLPASASSISINTISGSIDNLWIGTNTGLFYYSSNQLTGIPLSPVADFSPHILALHPGKKNILWVGTEKDGLFYIDTEKGTVQRQYINSIFNPYTISGNQVQYIYTDTENNLWVAAWGKGINYVNLEKFRFQHYLSKQETSRLDLDNFIRSIVEVKHGIFWCGTQTNGILVLDSNKNIIKKINNGLPPSIEHIYKDKEGAVWIATLSGLFQAESQTGKIQPVKGFEGSPLTSRQFNYFYELQNGSYLASTNSGIFVIKQTGEKTTVQPVKGVPANDVYLTSFQAGNGDIYLSRAFKGFAVYKLFNDSLILKKDFFEKSTVKCFAEGGDSILWIGSTKGLIRFNKHNLSITKTFTTTDGLANQYIYGALLNDNDIWLSTNAGISKFNTINSSFKNFSSEDGLQSNEFNTYSFCRSADGEMIFGGVNGINAFYPAQLKRNLEVPEILLQNIRINDTASVALHNPDGLKLLDLPFAQNTLSFQFVVIDYSNPLGCKFLYKLDGYDKDWISSSNKSIIRYANLPPGSYTLYAKAVSAEGIISNKIYSLEINIQTPWYKTWWFRLLVSVFIALLAWYLIKSFYDRKLARQKAELEKQNAIEQERTRMARDLHDGLGSMLSGIKHSFSALGNEMNLDQNLQNKFENNIDNLNDTINELRNISHSLASDGLLKNGLEISLKDYCATMSQPGVLNISFKAIDTKDMLLTENQAFHIFRIVQELLQNVIKHADAKNAIVQISYNAKHFYLAVEDDGRGFDREGATNSKGMGLKNIENRVTILNGHLDLRSERDKGSSVLIEIPCAEKPD